MPHSPPPHTHTHTQKHSSVTINGKVTTVLRAEYDEYDDGDSEILLLFIICIINRLGNVSRYFSHISGDDKKCFISVHINAV
jgi:hypothetical protein